MTYNYLNTLSLLSTFSVPFFFFWINLFFRMIFNVYEYECQQIYIIVFVQLVKFDTLLLWILLPKKNRRLFIIYLDFSCCLNQGEIFFGLGIFFFDILYVNSPPVVGHIYFYIIVLIVLYPFLRVSLLTWLVLYSGDGRVLIYDDVFNDMIVSSVFVLILDDLCVNSVSRKNRFFDIILWSKLYSNSNTNDVNNVWLCIELTMDSRTVHIC